jgi:hypothetical protein
MRGAVKSFEMVVSRRDWRYDTASSIRHSLEGVWTDDRCPTSRRLFRCWFLGDLDREFSSLPSSLQDLDTADPEIRLVHDGSILAILGRARAFGVDPQHYVGINSIPRQDLRCRGDVFLVDPEEMVEDAAELRFGCLVVDLDVHSISQYTGTGFDFSF